MTLSPALHRLPRGLVALLLLLSWGAHRPAMAGDRREDFPSRWPFQASDGRAFQRAEVPLELLFTPGPADLADLRVFDAAGRPVPFSRLPTSPQVEPRWSGHLPVTSDSWADGRAHFSLPRALPLHRLAVDLPGGNLVVPVRVFDTQGPERSWRELARGSLYRVQEEGSERLRSELDLGDRVVRQFALEVDPRLDPLPDGPQVRLATLPPQIVFLRQGDGPFELACGRMGSAPADLPIRALIPDWGTPLAPAIGVAIPLGAASTRSPAGPQVLGSKGATAAAVEGPRSGPAPSSPETQMAPVPAAAGDPERRRRWILWTVLLAFVVALGAMAFRLWRRLDA